MEGTCHDDRCHSQLKLRGDDALAALAVSIEHGPRMIQNMKNAIGHAIRPPEMQFLRFRPPDKNVGQNPIVEVIERFSRWLLQDDYEIASKVSEH